MLWFIPLAFKKTSSELIFHKKTFSHCAALATCLDLESESRFLGKNFYRNQFFKNGFTSCFSYKGSLLRIYIGTPKLIKMFMKYGREIYLQSLTNKEKHLGTLPLICHLNNFSFWTNTPCIKMSATFMIYMAI